MSKRHRGTTSPQRTRVSKSPFPLIRPVDSPALDKSIHNSDASLASIDVNLELFNERVRKCQQRYRSQEMSDMLAMLRTMPYFSRQLTPVCSVGFLQKVVDTELGLPPSARHGQSGPLRTLINLLDLVTYLRALRDVYRTRILLSVEVLTVTSSSIERMRKLSSCTSNPQDLLDVSGNREISGRPSSISSVDSGVKMDDDEEDNSFSVHVNNMLERWLALLNTERVWLIDDRSQMTNAIRSREVRRNNHLDTLIPQLLNLCHRVSSMTRRWLEEQTSTPLLHLRRRVQDLQIVHRDLSQKSLIVSREIGSKQDELKSHQELLTRLQHKTSLISRLSRKQSQTSGALDSVQESLRQAMRIRHKLVKTLEQPGLNDKDRQSLMLQCQMNDLYRDILTGKLRVADYDRKLAGNDLDIHNSLQPEFRDYIGYLTRKCRSLQRTLIVKTSQFNSLLDTMQPLKMEKWKLQEEILRRSMTEDI